MAEACSVRDDLSAYEDLNAKVLAISVDSPFAQEVMSQKEGLNFPLLSDFNKNVSQDYGILYEDFIGFKGVSKRSAFVVLKKVKLPFHGHLKTQNNCLIFLKSRTHFSKQVLSFKIFLLTAWWRSITEFMLHPIGLL